MPYCSNCGRRIYADDNFCSGCGQPVSRVASPSPISSSASPAVTEGRRQPRPVSTGASQPDSYSFSSGNTSRPTKSGTAVGKMISIIVILIVLTTIAVFIMGILGMSRAFW